MKLSDNLIASHGMAHTVKTILDEEQQDSKDTANGDEHTGFDPRIIENL